MQTVENVQKAAAHVASLLAPPAGGVGIVLGTGLGGLVGRLEDASEIPYAEIPGFPVSTVPGHVGRLWRGRVGQTNVLVLQGRFHLYEGYGPEVVCFGVRTLFALGIRGLVLTNAAGGLNPGFSAGELMLITDHINLTGSNPLCGPNVEEWGPRFPDMSRVYSPRLQLLAREQAKRLGIGLEHGIYLGLTGPCLETPAETRAFRLLGADAVGMSTVHEAIAARHLGLEILGISCLTNINLPDCMQETTLEDVLNQAQAAGNRLERLLAAVLENWPAA
jgi:purine-nucleoside phosphorylase